jgi:hypothetical protein
MPTQQQVDDYLNEIRAKGNEASTTFGCDETQVKKNTDDVVILTLHFIADTNQNGDVTPGEMKATENSAVSAAEDLRGFGAAAQVHSEGERTRVIAKFSP